MPAVKQKDGTWRVKKRDGTLGKRKFSTQANALAAQRGAPGKKKGTRSKKGGKTKAVTKTTRKSPAKKAAANATPAKPPKIGSAYTAGKASVMLFAPVTDEILAGQKAGTPAQEVLQAAAAKVRSIPYLYNLAVTAADAAIDRKTAQATALTMGSGTAMLPEVFLASILISEVRKRAVFDAQSARNVHSRLVLAHQGYDVQRNAIASDNDDFRTYRLLKHGGQTIRMLRGKSGIVKRLTAPLARVAKVFGGRI